MFVWRDVSGIVGGGRSNRINGSWTVVSSDNDGPLSDGKTALKKVKEAQEKRSKIQKGLQSNMLQHFSTPKATMSGGEKRWSFRCKYCPR